MKKILLLLLITTTSCGGALDLVYNQSVDTLTTTINYRYGQFGFGYYDYYGNFYGPNSIYFYGPNTPYYRTGVTITTSTRRGNSNANTRSTNATRPQKDRTGRSSNTGGVGPRPNVPKAQ